MTASSPGVSIISSKVVVTRTPCGVRNSSAQTRSGSAGEQAQTRVVCGTLWRTLKAWRLPIRPSPTTPTLSLGDSFWATPVVPFRRFLCGDVMAMRVLKILVSGVSILVAHLFTRQRGNSFPVARVVFPSIRSQRWKVDPDTTGRTHRGGEEGRIPVSELINYNGNHIPALHQSSHDSTRIANTYTRPRNDTGAPDK